MQREGDPCEPGGDTEAMPGPDRPGRLRAPPPGPWPVVAALMLAMALAAIDSTIVSTAVPQIVGDLGGFSVFSWLFSGYLLAVTVTLPVYGKLSDTFGRKPVLIAGIVALPRSARCCAPAPGTWPRLIAFRVVQGLGGGALQGTVQTSPPTSTRSRNAPGSRPGCPPSGRPPPSRARCSADCSPAYADWRWIFLINLPVGAVALWLIVRHLHEPVRAPPRHAAARIDWAGALAVFACRRPAADRARAGRRRLALAVGAVARPARRERRPGRADRRRSSGAPPSRSSPAGCGGGAPSPRSIWRSARWAC